MPCTETQTPTAENEFENHVFCTFADEDGWTVDGCNGTRSGAGARRDEICR